MVAQNVQLTGPGVVTVKVPGMLPLLVVVTLPRLVPMWQASSGAWLSLHI